MNRNQFSEKFLSEFESWYLNQKKAISGWGIAIGSQAILDFFWNRLDFAFQQGVFLEFFRGKGIEHELIIHRFTLTVNGKDPSYFYCFTYIQNTYGKNGVLDLSKAGLRLDVVAFDLMFSDYTTALQTAILKASEFLGEIK